MKQLNDKQLLITGATGFIGSCLCKRAINEGWAVRPVTRCAEEAGGVVIEDISPNTDWSATFKNVDVVIHLAARVHIMNDVSNNPLEEFRRLCSSLQVDNSKAKKILNWTPKVSLDEGLRKTAQHFLESNS